MNPPQPDITGTVEEQFSDLVWQLLQIRPDLQPIAKKHDEAVHKLVTLVNGLEMMIRWLAENQFGSDEGEEAINILETALEMLKEFKPPETTHQSLVKKELTQ